MSPGSPHRRRARLRRGRPIAVLELLGVLAIAVALALVAGCGGSGSSQASGAATDRAFVNDMTPHHESAIEMASIAERRAEHPEIRGLTASITREQRDEIAQMAQLKSHLTTGGSKATLGLDMHAMGMDMHTDTLKSAQPFDRAFIDMMVPHHQGAIAMAKVELAKGRDSAARALAQRIIATQQREVAQMNGWRTKWYGAPVPPGAMGGMSHH